MKMTPKVFFVDFVLPRGSCFNLAGNGVWGGGPFWDPFTDIFYIYLVIYLLKCIDIAICIFIHLYTHKYIYIYIYIYCIFIFPHHMVVYLFV